MVYGQLVPHMLQNTSWNWGAKLGFFYVGFMALSLIGAYFRVPETKNRIFADIDILPKNEVKARKFKKTKIDLATQAVIEE